MQYSNMHDVHSHPEGAILPLNNADSIDRITDELLAEASHELCTPLASIENSILLLRLGRLGHIPPEVEDVLQVVERNARRLMMMVENILGLEKLQNGRGSLEIREVDLDSLIAESIDLLRAEADKKRIALKYCPTGMRIEGDRKKLTQVVLNLLSNAIKFSPQGETVEISINSHVNERVTLSIADRGPGVGSEDRGRIFRKFEQTPSGIGKGTGLGLHIATRIVEQHQGKIGVSPRAEGGSVFWVRLKRSLTAGIGSTKQPPDSDQAA